MRSNSSSGDLPGPVQLSPGAVTGREPWAKPVLSKLPPLTDLTLQTGGRILGGGSGGGTVF